MSPKSWLLKFFCAGRPALGFHFPTAVDNLRCKNTRPNVERMWIHSVYPRRDRYGAAWGETRSVELDSSDCLTVIYCIYCYPLIPFWVASLRLVLGGMSCVLSCDQLSLRKHTLHHQCHPFLVVGDVLRQRASIFIRRGGEV